MPKRNSRTRTSEVSEQSVQNEQLVGLTTIPDGDILPVATNHRIYEPLVKFANRYADHVVSLLHFDRGHGAFLELQRPPTPHLGALLSIESHQDP